MIMDPRDRLIVALDLPSVAEAEAMVARLGDAVTFYKVGLELIYAGGLAFAQRLARSGKSVFLDAKLLDIDNTVVGAIRSIAAMGVTFVTVHAYPKTMRAAVRARGKTSLGLLGVTVLTSMSDGDLTDAAYDRVAAAIVEKRAVDALAAGMTGVVVSPAEARAIRRLVGNKMAIVTPGIRPLGAVSDDQIRVATPAAAIQAGADYLVVGRPITAAVDPLSASRAIQIEINDTLDKMSHGTAIHTS